MAHRRTETNRQDLHTLSISQLERREIITQQLRIGIVTFTVPTATAHVSTASRAAVLCLAIIVRSLLWAIFLFTIDSLSQILKPTRDLCLGIKETFAKIITNHRQVIYR